jgi:PAP2 superfamily protein
MMDCSSPRATRFAAFVAFAGLELALWAALYGAYLIVRGLAIGTPGEADAHAADVVGFERALGLFHERQLQHALRPAADVLSVYYVLGFGPLIAAVALWLALRQPARYRELRDALLLSIGLATIVFVAFPTAPPRLVPGLGIGDTVGLAGHDTGSFMGIRFDPYAAVPSMHVGWSAILAYAGFRATRRGLPRTFFLVHPALMLVTVTSTGNHFFLDAVAGLAVAGVAISQERWYPEAARKAAAIARYPPSVGWGSPFEQMNVSARIGPFFPAALPGGSNTGYMSATRACRAAATRAIVASIERKNGSIRARCSTSRFHAPARMICALGVAARSRATMESRRDPNAASPARECDSMQRRSPVHAGARRSPSTAARIRASAIGLPRVGGSESREHEARPRPRPPSRPAPEGADGRGRVSSSPSRRAVDRPRGVQLGSGTIRMYGLGSSQVPKSSLASSLVTEPAMMTSSPCCQLTGVETLCLAVSWRESMTRRTSSKLRPVVMG